MNIIFLIFEFKSCLSEIIFFSSLWKYYDSFFYRKNISICDTFKKESFWNELFYIKH